MSSAVRPLALLVCLLVAPAVPAGVVINEIQYNTPGSPDVEYVELLNTGPGAVNLSGWYLLDDDDAHTHCVLSGTLQEGEYLVVVGRFDLFDQVYPGVTAVNPAPFDSTQTGAGFGLGNASDRVRLFHLWGSLIDEVAYEDGSPWPADADGSGRSLELLNPALDNALPSSWAASLNGPPSGTPAAQNSVFVDDAPPLLDEVQRDIDLPTNADSVTVTARVSDDGTLASVAMLVDSGAGFTESSMFDDGLHGDGAAGDGVFGATIGSHRGGTVVRYYVQATDSLPQTVSVPAGAPQEYFAYTVDHQAAKLRINEILASNQNGIVDGGGDTDDWLEIRNPGPADVFLGGLFLTDDLGDSQRWPLPGTWLGAGESTIVWCDNEPVEGPFHASFTLPRARGEVGLFESVDHGNVAIHAFRFGPQSPDVSYGFFPDDSDTPEYLSQPTPGFSNDGSTLFSPLCINELQAGSQIPSAPDWVELLNRGNATIDIGGWHLSDDPASPGKYSFPPATAIAPGGRITVDSNALGFGLNASGEYLVLTDVDIGTGRDFLEFGAQLADVSLGRFPEGSANWHFFSPATPETANTCAIGIPPLDPVNGLRFGSATTLSWDSVAGADAYDTVRGNLLPLRSGAGEFGGAGIVCLENNGDPLAWDPDLPHLGGGFFYLARGVNDACGFGTWDAVSQAQAAGRDESIEGSPATCP